MIDLQQLEAKFEALFNDNIEESFNQWLQQKKENEIISLLGPGDLLNFPMFEKEVISETKKTWEVQHCNNNNTGNHSFANAA